MKSRCSAVRCANGPPVNWPSIEVSQDGELEAGVRGGNVLQYLFDHLLGPAVGIHRSERLRFIHWQCTGQSVDCRRGTEDNFSDGVPARMYKTGDLVVRTADKGLLWLGRMDGASPEPVPEHYPFVSQPLR